MTEAGAGRRRLLVALAAGLALLAALVALQLVDDGDDRSATNPDAPVQVKGIAVDRATLSGRVTGAERWRVEITVAVGGEQRTVVAAANGTYRVRDLVAGLAEVSWTARSEDEPAPAPDGVRVGGSVTGRTQIALAPGANTFDFAL